MNRILKRASRNFLFQHPWQLALALIGITLGVAVVIAIDLALESSLQSFEQATRAISGKASHRIVSSDGGLDEKLYTRLRVKQGIHKLAPVLQGYVQSGQIEGEHFKLYGIDPFIEGSFESVWQSQADDKNPSASLTRLITEPNTVLISKQTADRLQLNIDDHFSISTKSGTDELQLIGILDGKDAVSKQAMNNLIITDLSTAQELLDLPGKLSFIEVMADKNGSRNNALEAIRNSLPSDVILMASENSIQSMRQMTRAFNINLTALGLLSLLIGMFLIYNTMTFLVVQRRSLIGSLRSIGVTRRQIFTLIVNEALLLACIGTALGIAVGILIGHGLLQLISKTIDIIYFRVDGAGLMITPLQIGKGVLLGIGATFLAVLPPAWEATRVSPSAALTRSQLETGIRRFIGKAGCAGLIFIFGGMGLALSTDKSVTLGLGCIFLLLFGFALMTPSFTLLIMKPVEWLSGRLFGVIGKLPPRLVTAEISRTGVAIAALMIAVSATIGMDLMIDSFRRTVSDWVKTSLRADLYVSLPDTKVSVQKAISDRTLKDHIARLPGIQMLSSVLHTQVISKNGLTRVSVFELNEQSRPGFIFKQKVSDDLWNRFEMEQTVLVTEPYAYYYGSKIGQTIYLQTEKGQQPFEIIGIYTDYSGDQGHIAMTRKMYQRYWKDLGYTGIGIYAEPQADLDQLEKNVQHLLAPYQNLKSNHAIYEASMEVFEQTFVITDALRWLAAGIAFTGVFSALMALQFERRKQLGILRAIGITPRQLALLITTETGLMGLVAGLFAIPVGYIMAYVLIFIVYLRSFGWTMAFHPNVFVLLQGLVLALIAALLAGIIPAFKMAQTRPAEALHTE